MTIRRPTAARRGPRLARGGTLAWVLGFLAIVGSLAGVELYALYAHRQEHPLPPPAASAPGMPAIPGAAAFSVNPTGAPVGDVERPPTEAVIGPHIVLTGWATSPAGIKAVELRMEGRVFPARLGVTRLDVVRIRPELGTKTDTGWEFVGDFTGDVPPPGVNRRIFTIVAVGNDGKETILGRKSMVEPSALARWAAFTPQGRDAVLRAAGAVGHRSRRRVRARLGSTRRICSPTVRAGFRVPVLYLRMTRGAAHDYVFDPDWDPTRKCGARRIGDDSLNAVLAHSKASRCRCS